MKLASKRLSGILYQTYAMVLAKFADLRQIWIDNATQVRDNNGPSSIRERRSNGISGWTERVFLAINEDHIGPYGHDSGCSTDKGIRLHDYLGISPYSKGQECRFYSCRATTNRGGVIPV